MGPLHRGRLDDPGHPAVLTAEHLVRCADGGQDTPSNVVAACADCNRDRERREDGISHVRVRAITRPHVVCEATG
ncbi:HNH endonuclease [Methylorubrum thiocyanatum]|uniref:HNH endonuclease n=1 Tax=Methylorubrum thiocyanatum TaxID=47958 RepID=UPI00383A3CB3